MNHFFHSLRGGSSNGQQQPRAQPNVAFSTPEEAFSYFASLEEERQQQQRQQRERSQRQHEQEHARDGAGQASSSPFASFVDQASTALASAFSRQTREQQQPQHGPENPLPTASGASPQQAPPPEIPVGRAPPASYRSVCQLPLVTVTAADLVEPANRECCVCLDSIQLNDRVIRLPCAHIFHPSCIREWLLEQHCTCPVCRYELPTDDPFYEVYRQERMRTRKPRFARHELDRLSIKQLKQLLLSAAKSNGERYHPVEKRDLIEYLIQSGSIDLVAAPEPVHYSLCQLKNMSVRELRKVMNEDAGVFFDPRDVIEKDDMLRIFLLSGRLSIVEEQEEEGHGG